MDNLIAACLKFDLSVPEGNSLTWGLLFTFSAILVAFLSLWAQITVKTSQGEDSLKKRTATIGLLWIYMAIAPAMIASGFLLFAYFGQILDDIQRYFVYRIALGLILTAFLMGFLHICESLLSFIRRIQRGETLFDTIADAHSDQEFKHWAYWLIGGACGILLFSLSGTLLGGSNIAWYWLWVGNLLVGIIIYLKYRTLISQQPKIKLTISDKRMHKAWQKVLWGLPLRVEKDLRSWIRMVKDTDQNLDNKYLYGNYGDGDHTIIFYKNDFSELSDKALCGLAVHELGHAFCHAKWNNASPFGQQIDTAADAMATAWGFGEEISIFNHEKKPIAPINTQP